jgi:hypothetical protein
MDGRDPEAGDDLHVEVSDVRPGGAGAPAPQFRSPLEARLGPRQRRARLAIVLACGLLALAVVLAGIPAVRSGAAGLIARLGPSPTPAVAPGEDLFYLLPNPPGVDVSLDGHVLTSPPLLGDPHPLRLARGRHMLSWRSRDLPFVSQRCTVSVPRASGDTCSLVNPNPRYPSGTFPSGGASVIGVRASLATLDPAQGQKLTGAVQAALDAARSSAIVQPGERYFYYTQGQQGGPVVATQPLRATLGYQLVIDHAYPEPCILAQGVDPCRFPGQDCSYLCTVPHPPSAVGSGGDWIAGALVSASWDYQTLDGRTVARGIGEQFGVQLMALRIALDSAGWHVTPIFGHTPDLPVADDPVCAPARSWLAMGTWSFMLVDPPPGAQVQFASDATPADGCVAVLNQAPPTAPSAVFLERFGVLLTVNEVARNPTDNLPVADPAEQSLAQRLAAQLSP